MNNKTPTIKKNTLSINTRSNYYQLRHKITQNDRNSLLFGIVTPTIKNYLKHYAEGNTITFIN